MLKKSYITLLNLFLLVVFSYAAVKAAQVWWPSELIKDEKLEERNLPTKIEKTEIARKVKLALSDYEVIEEQNLFHHTRKKLAEAPPPTPAPQVATFPTPQPTPTPQPEIINPPSVVFYGTSREDGNMYALIQSKSEQKPRKYNLNEEVDGYKITDIKRSQVTLSRQGKDFSIKLWEPNPKKNAGTPPIQQPVMQQPVMQQPNIQQPIIQPGVIPTPIMPGVTPNRINRGRPLPYPNPGQQIPQPANPYIIPPGQEGYNIQQPQPELDQDFQDTEEGEEGPSGIPSGIPNVSPPVPVLPNGISPNVPGGIPYPVPTPIVIPPRYHQ
ncbi:MAG TPA: hypothetical protein VNM22_07040 [Candidatus Limnocylindrales bacterium]|nr:hypothetical protein [Candidatus Limnocylindrales bacterium]